MAQVKVFGSRISVYSLRVELALKLKGVDYEFNQEDLANKSPLLLKYNPVHKKIPVLVHNEKPVAESLVILEYIDETFDGPAILPADPYERAMARFWSRFFDDKVAPAIRKVCTNSGEEQEKGKEEFIELLKFLEHELEGKKFFGGNTIGFVDIAATFLSWFPVIEKLIGVEILSDDHSFPNVYNWIQEYQNSSLVKENTPSKDQLTEQFKGYLKMQSTSK